MYSVHYNDTLIHYSISPMDELHLIDPELTMGDSVAGSLNFTMLTTNPGYNAVERMRGLITVKRDNVVIWTGRVITQSEDFWKRRTCTSEGALAFLNDTNQDMVTYKNTTMLTFLTRLLEVHNSKVPANRKIYLGTVTVNDKNDSHQYQTNYKSTWEELQTNLLDRLGGHIRIRYDGSTPKLDYLASYPKAATQEINFGQNLLDFTKNWDLSNLVTVILPRGKQLDEEDANGQRDYVTVASVNGGDKFVKNQNAYNTYGRIERIVDFSDVESPSQLLTLAQNYVSAQQFDDMSLNVSAIDLHTLTGSVLAFDLLDEVRCISRPHGMDTWFPVNEVKIPLEHPENTTYSMGASRPSPMSSKASENTQTFLQKLANYLSIATILEQAKANATEIMEMVTTGYINIITENETSQAIVISNTPDVESATKLWKFSMNGLGYLDKTKSQDYEIAITMDGSIVADFINTGRITDGNSYWDLTSGSLFISPLSSFGSNSKTVQDVVDVIDETITGVDVEYAQNQSPTVAPTSGWATTAPAWQNGYYIWQRTATTNALGTSYSTPTCISGANGKDGTSVSILGSYNTVNDLETAHPTGNQGDAYIVNGDLYVWNTSAWENVGRIQGPAGQNGASVTVVSIQYGTSSSASEAPSGYSTTVPVSIEKGKWLWIKTTYSDASSAITKSYIGTDGTDGKSVYVQSATKSGDTTTVVLSDGTTTSTLTIKDGDDGTNGTNGLNGYVHTAWANSANGVTDFSTSDSSNKKYLGVYTNNSSTDSTNPSDYSWSLIKGADGESITVTSVEYGISTSASEAPSGYSTTVPVSIEKGKWLWIRTTYSDTTTTISKTYVGADGKDGKSVYVQSTSKVGDTTTIVLTNGTTTNTITIKDGEDGSNGTNGVNGLNGYIHTAWANSANGYVNFSTTDSTGKMYLGVYTDNIQADSNEPSDYSWSLIKGSDGSDGLDGADGRGVRSIVEQYYLSTSGSSVTGGSWSTEQPNFSNGKYIWTRSLITWDDGTTSTTTAVLAKALNSAYSTATTASTNASSALTKANTAITDAANAAKVANNYLSFNSTNGLDVGYSGTKAKTRVKGNGVEIFDSAGNSTLFAGIENNKSIVRVGRASGSGNVIMSSDGYVDIRNASTVLAHFGYGEGINSSGGKSVAPYYSIGVRKSGNVIGNYSIAEGYNTAALSYCSHAEGCNTTAGSYYSHAEGYGTNASVSYAHAEGQNTTASNYSAHAEGQSTTASGQRSHAEGMNTTASGANSHAEGVGTIASRSSSHAGGSYNISNSNHILIYGRGISASSRANAMYLDSSGKLWIASTLTQNSDRRLKEHHAYLGEDACEFVRKLKPALYTKDGERHVGFYAQDVQEAEPDEWNTVTVTEQHTDESLDFDPLTLEYTALIAPLVAYAQMLERRLDEQQSQIDALTKRMEALERR